MARSIADVPQLGSNVNLFQIFGGSGNQFVALNNCSCSKTCLIVTLSRLPEKCFNRKAHQLDLIFSTYNIIYVFLRTRLMNNCGRREKIRRFGLALPFPLSTTFGTLNGRCQTVSQIISIP